MADLFKTFLVIFVADIHCTVTMYAGMKFPLSDDYT